MNKPLTTVTVTGYMASWAAAGALLSYGALLCLTSAVYYAHALNCYRLRRRELAMLEALPDDEIDTRDIPEVVDWSGAQRGRFYGR